MPQSRDFIVIDCMPSLGIVTVNALTVANGVLSPVLVRPRTPEQGYEMISCHRRLHASKKAGLDYIPAIIKEMSDDEATIAIVNSNVQREEILPSERACLSFCCLDSHSWLSCLRDYGIPCRF